MKTCFKCGIEKPMGEFYTHKAMADGHLNKCKQCTKDDVNAHRLANLSKCRAYDRERAKEVGRIKSCARVSDEWRKKDKRRTAAHNAVARAVKAGKLDKRPCQRCSAPKAIAHHEDYDKPLDVVWLCQPCHKQRHKELASDN